MHSACPLEPLWFGRERSGCFGMLHAPKIPSSRGVVLCNTFGFDGLVADRAFRHLADDLAARGFWVLRFDYDGEGDSAGGPWEPHQLTSWIADIDAAVGVLRSRAVSDVRLVGFRAGASLAYLYATTHAGVSGVALWWPYVSGSAYVRELRALSRLSTAARPVQRVAADRFPADSLEVCGFEFGAAALADLGAIDLVAAPELAPAPPTLLIERSDAASSDDFIARLEHADSTFQHEQMPGYADFMIDDGVKSVLPLPILQRICDWLDDAPLVASNGHAPAPYEGAVREAHVLSIDDPNAGHLPPPEPARDCVVEQPVWINGRLFSIVSSPGAHAPIRRVCIVLCTTGANTRIGPGRLYVDLARYWANLGFTVVRVDLGGVGDSLAAAPGTENQWHAPIRIDELRETVEWARQRADVDHVVLYGLCSGAFNAFHAAIEGVDLSSTMLVNPGMFYLGADQSDSTSPEARLGAAHALGRGLMSPRKWRLVFREQGFTTGLRRARHLLRSGATDGARFVVGAFARNAARRVGLRVGAPSPLARDLEQITARGVKVLMVFAAGESAAHYVRVVAGSALEPMLRSDALEIIDIDGGDHVFSSPGSRQRLFEVTTQYLEREYPLRSVHPNASVRSRERSELA